MLGLALVSQMKLGYMRLQALYYSRQLTHQFVTLRRKVMIFQVKIPNAQYHFSSISNLA